MCLCVCRYICMYVCVCFCVYIHIHILHVTLRLRFCNAKRPPQGKSHVINSYLNTLRS